VPFINRSTTILNNKNEIEVMYHDVHYNEKPSKQAGIIQKNLKVTRLTVEELAIGLSNGCSFRPAILNGTKSEDWNRQQVFALDFDHGTKIQAEINKCIELNLTPCFIYTSFSHNPLVSDDRFRMVFVTDTVVTDRQKRNRLQRTLIGIFPNSDKVAYDEARLFFGGIGKTPIHPNYEARINADDVISKYFCSEFEAVINNKKTKKVETDIKVNNEPQENKYSNIQAIRDKNESYLKEKLRQEPIQFDNKEDFWHYVFHNLDIAELLEVDNPKSFNCIFHEDNNPSASIFTTNENVQVYKCFSDCHPVMNIKQVIEAIGGFNSEYKAINFLKSIYNLSIAESQRSTEQKENLDNIIKEINLNNFANLCPQADKNNRFTKSLFLILLEIAKENIFSENYCNSNGEVVFFTSYNKLAKLTGTAQNHLNRIGARIKILAYHNLIRQLPDEEIPPKMLEKAYKIANENGHQRVEFYSIPSWVIEHLKVIEEKAELWKKNGYTTKGVSFEMFYRTEGLETAQRLYPTYKYTHDLSGMKIARSTTKASDDRTIILSEILLELLEAKGYATEKEVISYLADIYKKYIAEKQLKKSLAEIMDMYGLTKIRASNELKETYNIKSSGYPYIIIKSYNGNSCTANI
jgi:hypothetical protein